MCNIEIGKANCLKEGKDIAVLTLGPIGNAAIKAIEEAEKTGISIAHYDMRFLRPLDEDILHHIANNFKKVVTIEDGVIKGGFGSAIIEFFSDNNYSLKVKRIGIPDNFIEHGTPDELYSMLKMDSKGIKDTLLSI